MGNPPQPDRKTYFREVSRDWQKIHRIFSTREYTGNFTIEVWEIYLDSKDNEVCRRQIISQMYWSDISPDEIIKGQRGLIDLYGHYLKQTQKLLTELEAGAHFQAERKNQQIFKEILEEHGINPEFIDIKDDLVN